MKRIKKIGVLIMTLCLLLTSIVMPAEAVSSSKKFKTGFKKNQVIRTVKAQKKLGGRRVGTYTKTKDVYVSEKILLDQFVRAESNWYVTEDTDELSVSKSKKVTVSSEAEVAKGLKMKISVEVSETLGSKHKPNPKKGDLCRIAVRCDYVEVSFIRYTYNQNGKQIGKKNMKVKIPIEGTAVKYLEYDK